MLSNEEPMNVISTEGRNLSLSYVYADEYGSKKDFSLRSK
jgi:hypothetical protein